ncbi:MAG TPA: S26 family signal peptidase [Thermoplasmatales archaeon]|nr:S26 family signal peptidase [Thermoplasmatales archaeon]
MEIDEVKEKIMRFWRSEDENISLVRDILVALLVVAIILVALWSYTGQWFGAPMVAIESGSMMHQNEPFGRIGTIDAGDMVLLVKVYGRDDVLTREGEKAKGNAGFRSYGDYGDVIVYKKYGRNDEDQIIHRAICWIDYNEKAHTYTIEEYNMYNVSSITIPDIGLINYRPTHSGFITKGDNPITNDRCDQAGGICSEPIKPEWITGKAGGELPWVGTINLLFNDLISGRLWSSHPTVSNVPPDSITCLVILISVLVAIPLSFDIYDYYKKNYQKKTS